MSTYRRRLTITKFDFLVKCASAKEMMHLKAKVLNAKRAYRTQQRRRQG